MHNPPGCVTLIYKVTKETNKSIPSQFQNHWAREISKTQWGLDVQIRIGLRHDLGREPTREEIGEAHDDGKYRNVPIDIIKEAFGLGHEVRLSPVRQLYALSSFAAGNRCLVCEVRGVRRRIPACAGEDAA